MKKTLCILILTLISHILKKLIFQQLKCNIWSFFFYKCLLLYLEHRRFFQEPVYPQTLLWHPLPSSPSWCFLQTILSTVAKFTNSFSELSKTEKMLGTTGSTGGNLAWDGAILSHVEHLAFVYWMSAGIVNDDPIIQTFQPSWEQMGEIFLHPQ